MTQIATESRTSPSAAGRGALSFAGLAAILASTCCLGPLALLLMGFTGSWIGNLTPLEPYRPLFVVAAVAALFVAYRKIFRPDVDCQPGEVCAVPLVRTTYKVLFGLVAALVLIAVVFPFVVPLFY